MKKLRVDDPDRPIESYGGYLGMYFDGEYQLESILRPLLDFPWKEYRDLEVDGEDSSVRTILFSVGGSQLEVEFDRDEIYLLEFLDLLPTVELGVDEVEGNDLGPASGGVMTVWESDSYSSDEIEESIDNCLDALRKDYEVLRRNAKT